MDRATKVAQGLYRSDQRYARSVRRPMKSKAMKGLASPKKIRDNNVNIEGNVVTKNLYPPQFLDNNGNPYPLFAQAPVATYASLQLSGVAMDFFNFYDGTISPNYRDPRYPDLLVRNMELSNFRSVEEEVTEKGTVVRKLKSVDRGGANSRVLMDTNLDIDPSEITEEFNTLDLSGFNNEILWEVVESVQNQYEIYYDAVREVLLRDGNKNNDIPQFKPIYPTFNIGGVEYDALDYRLHINTLVRSTVQIFQYTLGSQTIDQFRQGYDTFDTFKRQQIVWIWDDNVNQEMQKIISLARDQIGPDENGKYVNIDLAMDTRSPVMVRAARRQRSVNTRDIGRSWGEFSPNVNVQDRSMAIANYTGNRNKLEELCSFFLTLRKNQELKRSIFGDEPLKGLSRAEREARGESRAQVLANTYDRAYSNQKELINKFLNGELDVDAFYRKLVIYNTKDTEAASYYDNMSSYKNENANDIDLDDTAKEVATAYALESTIKDDPNTLQVQFLIRFVNAFGVDFFKFLNILGYTDRFFGFKLYLQKPEDGTDDLKVLCDSVNYVYVQKPLEEWKKIPPDQLRKETQNAYSEIAQALINLVQSIPGKDALEDKVLRSFTQEYYARLALTSAGVTQFAKLLQEKNLPQNLNYKPNNLAASEGVYMFDQDITITNITKGLSQLRDTKFGACSYETLIELTKSKKYTTLLTILDWCRQGLAKVNPIVERKTKKTIVDLLQRYGYDPQFFSNVRIILEAFDYVTKDYGFIKGWIEGNAILGQQTSNLRAVDEDLSAKRDDFTSQFEKVLWEVIKPINLNLRAITTDANSFIRRRYAYLFDENKAPAIRFAGSWQDVLSARSTHERVQVVYAELDNKEAVLDKFSVEGEAPNVLLKGHFVFSSVLTLEYVISEQGIYDFLVWMQSAIPEDLSSKSLAVKLVVPIIKDFSVDVRKQSLIEQAVRFAYSDYKKFSQPELINQIIADQTSENIYFTGDTDEESQAVQIEFFERYLGKDRMTKIRYNAYMNALNALLERIQRDCKKSAYEISQMLTLPRNHKRRPTRVFNETLRVLRFVYDEEARHGRATDDPILFPYGVEVKKLIKR